MPRGMLWGVAFQKWLSRSASTGISGGGRGGERQTRKSTFFLGSVPAKWISGPRFGHLWTMPNSPPPGTHFGVDRQVRKYICFLTAKHLVPPTVATYRIGRGLSTTAR